MRFECFDLSGSCCLSVQILRAFGHLCCLYLRSKEIMLETVTKYWGFYGHQEMFLLLNCIQYVDDVNVRTADWGHRKEEQPSSRVAFARHWSCCEASLSASSNSDLSPSNLTTLWTHSLANLPVAQVVLLWSVDVVPVKVVVYILLCRGLQKKII